MIKVQVYQTIEELTAAMIVDVKVKVMKGIHLAYFSLDGKGMTTQTHEEWLRGNVFLTFGNDIRKVADWIPFRIDDIEGLVEEAMPDILVWWNEWYPEYRRRLEKRMIQDRIFMETFQKRIPPILKKLRIPYSLGVARGGISVYMTLPGKSCIALKIKASDLSEEAFDVQFRQTVEKLRDAFSAAQAFGLKIQPVDNDSCYKNIIPKWLLPDSYTYDEVRDDGNSSESATI